MIARATWAVGLLLMLGVPIHLAFLATPDCGHPADSWLWCTGFEAANPLDQVQLVHGLVSHGGSESRSGRSALRIGGEAHGGGVTWMACEKGAEACAPRQFRRLFVRAWVKLHDSFSWTRHFLEVGGRDRLEPYGAAGCLPNGHSEYMTFLDLDRQLRPHFYTYHLGMRCDPGCGRYTDVQARCEQCAERGFPTCEVRPRCCWGQRYSLPSAPSLVAGAWSCLELEVSVNSPGQRDGLQRAWLNDRILGSVRGLAWSADSRLGVTYARLQTYLEPGDVPEPHPVWLDDVVVATERIGCGVMR